MKMIMKTILFPLELIFIVIGIAILDPMGKMAMRE